MRICIVGGVAGGASAAARLRRLDEHASITVFEKGPFVSFANCGLPYALGGVIASPEKLILQTPDALYKRFRLDVRVETEVLEILREQKTLRVRSSKKGVEEHVPYDKLILATGARPLNPWARPGVHTLTSLPDLEKCIDWIKKQKVKRMAVIGGGYIGIEAVENLRHLGLEVTLFHSGAQLLPPLAEDLSRVVEETLKKHGVKVMLQTRIESIEGEGPFRILAGGESCEADGVLVAIGVEPASELAKKAGLLCEPGGGILVSPEMQTSDLDIYAVGDVCGIEQPPLGFKEYLPLAGPANRQGRLAADHILGRPCYYTGTLGTSVVKVFDLEVAFTGHHEKQLKKKKRPFDTVVIHPYQHVTYYPGASMLSMKLFYDPKDGLLLGAQAVGKEGSARRIDVIATAIYARLTVQDLERLELCYAPPYGAAKDPVNMLGFQASNVWRGDLKVISVEDFLRVREPYLVLDVRSEEEFEKGHVTGAVSLPLEKLRDSLETLPRDAKILTCCQVGFRGYLAYRILVQHGFKDVTNLSGGYESYSQSALGKNWKF